MSLDYDALRALMRELTPPWHSARGRYVLRVSDVANDDCLVIAPYESGPFNLPGIVMIRRSALDVLLAQPAPWPPSHDELAAIIGWHAEERDRERRTKIVPNWPGVITSGS